MNRTTQERFDAKYIPEPNSGCWLWDAMVDKDGYGRIKIAGRIRRAHCVSYELHTGPIPEGHGVLHKCDVPGCVNPQHLFTGTTAVNMADKVAKGRQARGSAHGFHTKPESRPRGDRNGSRAKPWTRPRGEQSGMCRYTDEQVAALRKAYADGLGSVKALAASMGFKKSQAHNIINGTARVPYKGERHGSR